ncbi:MAG: hypothetical protein A4E58_02183 [Syntrophorhabdus sp. PtaB.Bin006]|nr:MAG: hypothetical protein A4E58_02183 [Syntrophorhabdus sp. PtaB.Bin006]
MFLGILLLRYFSEPLDLTEPVLNDLQIGDNDLRLNDVHVPSRVHVIVNMGHILRAETTQHVGYGVYIPNVGEKLISQPLAFVGVLDKTRYVDKFNRSGSHLFRLQHLHQLHESLIGNRNDAHIGLNGTKRVRLAGHGQGGQGIEYGGFAGVG